MPPGSIFDIDDSDIPGALTVGMLVGDKDPLDPPAFLAPGFLGGNILGSDSQLNVFNGGTVRLQFDAGPPDGSGSNIEVNIFGGVVEVGFGVHSGSTVNVSGGDVGQSVEVFDGGTMNISGGSVGYGVTARTGGSINISGGAVGDRFCAASGSTVTLSGGTIGRNFIGSRDSSISILGGAFEVDGSPTSGLPNGFGSSIPERVFTGVFEDGSVFIFAAHEADAFRAGALTLQAVPVAPSANPGLLSSGTFTKGLRSGETLTVTGNGKLGNDFSVVGGVLNIDGGEVGHQLEIAFGEANISGGVVEGGLSALIDSTVNISGGVVGHGARVGSGSTMRISGGSVGDGFEALPESIVEISGGSIGHDSEAKANTVVNISGGSIGSSFEAAGAINMSGGSIGRSLFTRSGSTMNISGGTLGGRMHASGDVTFIGGSFELNGTPTENTPTGFTSSATTPDVLSGVLADGSVFIFSNESGDRFKAGNTTLEPTTVAPSTNPGQLSAGTFDKGLRAGETLTVSGDGKLGDNFAVVGGTLNVDNGSVGRGLEVAYGEVNVSGGVVDRYFGALAGSKVDISGGTVDAFLTAYSGSDVDISGGLLLNTYAEAGSDVDVSGGVITLFSAEEESRVVLSGGSIAFVSAESDSDVTVRGGAFDLEGSDTNDLSAGLGSYDFGLFTGIFEDGSVFVFSSSSGDRFDAGTTTLETVAVAPSDNPGVLSSGTYTKGVRSGETLTVTESGELGHAFAVVGGTLNIEGGSTGSYGDVVSGEVNLSGGSLGWRFSANAFSTVHISGGSVGSDFSARRGSVVNISGGSVGDEFRAYEGSTVNLFGSTFSLDGVELTDLVVGEEVVIMERNRVLSGIFTDGSAFEFNLNSLNVSWDDFFSPGARLTVTLVPAPGTVGLLAASGLLAGRRRRR